MPTPDLLNDTQAHERLHLALLALGQEGGQSVAAATALTAARRALMLLQIGLVAASEGYAERPAARD